MGNNKNEIGLSVNDVAMGCIDAITMMKNEILALQSKLAEYEDSGKDNKKEE